HATSRCRVSFLRIATREPAGIPAKRAGGAGRAPCSPPRSGGLHFMNRLASVVVAGILVLSACADQEAPTAPSSPVALATPTPAPTPEPSPLATPAPNEAPTVRIEGETSCHPLATGDRKPCTIDLV